MIINNHYDIELLNKIQKQINVIRINRKPNSININNFLNINKTIYQIKPDIIHCHNEDIIPLISPFLRYNLVLTVHQNSPKKRYLKYFDTIVAVSDNVKNNLSEKINSNIDVIENGLDLTEYKEKTNHQPKETFKIVQIGRLDISIKGQDILIKAVDLLINKGFDNIEVDLIGDGVSFNHLNELINSYSLEEKIKIYRNKNREYIKSELCNYDLLVHPSINEAFGLTVIEASACCLPVIVSENTAPADILQKDKYGYTFKNGDHLDLADKISFIINNYGQAYKKCILSKEHITKNYNINNTINNYYKIYNKQINKYKKYFLESDRN